MNHKAQDVFRYAKIAACASLVCLDSIQAQAAVFDIDPTRSSISLSGSALGFPLQQQSSGSLTTTFAGTINATVTDATILFTGSSLIAAQNSGNWEPKAKGEPGSEPANFGGKASGGFLGSVMAAVRNSQWDVTSSLLPITATRFDSGSVLFQFLPGSAGSLDYSVAGLLAAKGSIALAGLATNRVTAQAALVNSGNTQTLTIPVTADFFFKLVSVRDTTLTITGQIVATRSVDSGGSSFETWLVSKFAGAIDPSVIGIGADPDNDGIPNFVEFAFGLNPTVIDRAFAPLKASLSAVNPNQLIVEFARPKGLTGVNYGLLVSDDLRSWTAISAAPEITDLGGGQEKVIVRDNSPVSAKRGRFVRLTVGPA